MPLVAERFHVITVWAVLLLVLGTLAPTALGAVATGEYDLELDSQATYWAGQRLYFNGSEVVADVADAPRDDRTFQVRRVTTDNDVAGLVTEFVVDTDGEAVIETATLDGFYIVRYDGETVYVQDGTGYTQNPPDGTAVTVANSRWEVAQQWLEATWSADRIRQSEPIDLELRSNRASYRVEISADGLDFDELEAMFDPADFADDHDAEADDDIIILDAGTETALEVDFSDVDDGRYRFLIEVADSTASATVQARVGQVPQETPRPTAEPPAPTPTATATPTPIVTPTLTRTPTALPETPTAFPTMTTAAETATPTATQSPVVTTPQPPATGTETPGQPGFGLGVGLLALFAIVLLALRRR